MSSCRLSAFYKILRAGSLHGHHLLFFPPQSQCLSTQAGRFWYSPQLFAIQKNKRIFARSKTKARTWPGSTPGSWIVQATGSSIRPWFFCICHLPQETPFDEHGNFEFLWNKWRVKRELRSQTLKALLRKNPSGYLWTPYELMFKKKFASPAQDIIVQKLKGKMHWVKQYRFKLLFFNAALWLLLPNMLNADSSKYQNIRFIWIINRCCPVLQYQKHSVV